MLSKIQNELLFAGVIKKSNEKVRKDILEDNRKASILWATIQLIFWSFSLFMSRIDSEYIDCLPIYIIVLVICGVALFLALYVCPKHEDLATLRDIPETWKNALKMKLNESRLWVMTLDEDFNGSQMITCRHGGITSPVGRQLRTAAEALRKSTTRRRHRKEALWISRCAGAPRQL